ncbi:MAG: electron transfer flavoprotein subunit beta/FixA family protein [Clostridia bacterium]|nr:electron transfer flavoprotein subunit beta/FixA family protein [Clostridia bacterium]MDH7572727.1 electron transfer flavoprotein subunit beta/FixA family protein [Clostridia bacterium]
MNIVVLLKQTFDTEAKIELTADGKISSAGVNLIINPYDEFAVEEALKLKEKFGGEVVVVSVGGAQAQDAIRQALAMGADRGVLVQDPALEGADHAGVAQALAKAVSTLSYDLILTGWVAIDDNAAQVPGRVAEILNLPQVNLAVKVEVDGNRATVHREGEGATEILEVPLPALITAQKGLNEPRYPSMKGIMQAKKKPIQQLSLADLGLSADAVGAAAAKVTVTSYSLPPKRAGGRLLEGEPQDQARELVRLLREEAKVI